VLHELREIAIRNVAMTNFIRMTGRRINDFTASAIANFCLIRVAFQ
jgi:hypothetical protein